MCIGFGATRHVFMLYKKCAVLRQLSWFFPCSKGWLHYTVFTCDADCVYYYMQWIYELTRLPDNQMEKWDFPWWRWPCLYFSSARSKCQPPTSENNRQPGLALSATSRGPCQCQPSENDNQFHIYPTVDDRSSVHFSHYTDEMITFFCIPSTNAFLWHSATKKSLCSLCNFFLENGKIFTITLYLVPV